jgi:hypothetical protein
MSGPPHGTTSVTAGLESAHTVVGRGFDEPDHAADAVGLR